MHLLPHLWLEEQRLFLFVWKKEVELESLSSTDRLERQSEEERAVVVAVEVREVV
jgi:hypothetical protein